MENLAMRIVFDQKGKAKKDSKKKAMIHIEIRDIVTNKKTYIPTNVKILFEHYAKDGTIINSKHPNGAILRKNVQSIFNRIEAFIFSEKCKSFDDIQKWDKSEEELTTNIVDFIRADLIKRNVSFATLEYNNSFIKRLEEFGRIKTFQDLSYTNIEDFDLHLKKTIKSQPTLYKRHSLFKGYIEKARRRGLIKTNPYDEFAFKKGKSEDPVYLIESELKQIISYVPKGAVKESLQRVKDLFLFQCFTGLSYTGKNGKIDPLKTEEKAPLKLSV